MNPCLIYRGKRVKLRKEEGSSILNKEYYGKCKTCKTVYWFEATKTRLPDIEELGG